MRDITVAITAASYSGNKGAAAMLQSSISQLYERYGYRLNVNLMSVYPDSDRTQCPWDFVKIISCKPQQLLFFAFPLAVLYRVLGWCPPVRRLLLKNRILKAYKGTDLVIDEAGISFVDSRGFVMNTYAFVCAAVPLLMGVPVVKYSQALGTFRNPYNRFLARWILPKLSLICARGKITQENLAGIGIRDNVRLCADGAFSMPDNPAAAEKVQRRCEEDAFYTDNVVGLSLSSVVDGKCSKQGIDYRQYMTQFADWLTEEGYHVLIIANAARLGSEKPRNNDLQVCDDVYGRIWKKEMVRWYHEEMDAEEIREYISRCRFLVASRFHAMVGALEKEVPVLLIGWSHKYQEVLDFFDLGTYAADYSDLNPDALREAFCAFRGAEKEIRVKLRQHHDEVFASSKRNIEEIAVVLDKLVSVKPKGRQLLQWDRPERYTGDYICMRMGYAADESIRQNAASGGMVTALLEHMLRTGEIDGAWVTGLKVENGHLGYRSFIATTPEEIRSCSSSTYMQLPILKHVEALRSFDGRVAVVMTPCQMKAFSKLLERDSELKKKVVLKLGLFCSGNPGREVTELSLRKAGISLEGACGMYYRRGHWRGTSSVQYLDGTEKTFSYKKLFCTYKNAYFFERKSCTYCQDHFSSCADISFGDIWLKSMKKDPVKHTCCVIRSETALKLYQNAVRDGVLVDRHISGKDMIRGQKRALVYKFCTAEAKAKRTDVKLDTEDRCKWNHRLAYRLAAADARFSEMHPDKLEKIPSTILYGYMCVIRALLSF